VGAEPESKPSKFDPLLVARSSAARLARLSVIDFLRDVGKHFRLSSLVLGLGCWARTLLKVAASAAERLHAGELDDRSSLRARSKGGQRHLRWP
jgi:hypothetical protein